MTAPIPTTKEQIDNITSNNDAYLCHSLRNSLSTLGWVKNKKRYETLDIETKKLRRRVLTYGKLIEKGLKGINCDENPKKINKKETIYNL